MGKPFSTIKLKIVTLCVLVSVIFSFILCYSIYTNMKESVLKDQARTTEQNLKLIMDNVDRELLQIYRLVLWCSSDDDVHQFLTGTKQPYTTFPSSITAFDALNAQIFNSSIESYINKIILCSNDDRYIIQGNSYGMNSDVEIITKTPYFNKLLTSVDYNWIGIQDEPFTSSLKGECSIPIVRPVIHSDSGANIGWVYLSLNPDIMTGKVMNYIKDADYDMYWCIDDKIYICTSTGFEEFNGSIDYVNEITEHNSVTMADILIDNRSEKAIRVDSQSANWYLLQTIPPPSISESSFSALLIPMFAILIFSALFIYLLQRMVTKPVIRICKRIKKISKGDFSEDHSIESNDEFGFIGQGINDMTHSISKLMSDQIETEKVKRELELSVLQNQINPHFLYNTLNTIKWMAVIQNATGISQVTESLAKLLKNISKNTDSLITLREELELLEDYILIQSYRYSDMFEYSCSVDDNSLYDCMIIKFSLQPIIENAIFHGIEPKNGPGKIVVNVTSEGSCIKINIWDDGIGISESTIRDLLGNDQNSSSGIFKKIGLRNVDQRIRLEYGKSYGVSIKSVIGKYTEVSVLFPIIQKEYTSDE